MEAAAALTTTTGAQYSCCFGLAHGGAAQRRRRTAAGFGAARWSGRRLRALPPQVSEFLSPEQLVPGSPADTGDEPKKAEESEEAASSPAATMSVAGDGQPEAKIRLKVKKTKKNKKAAMKV
uniref:Uncharacterized protein n=2 Tax=Oryza TaxID=4527 RepID=A0A0E0PH01_ORYRU